MHPQESDRHIIVYDRTRRRWVKAPIADRDAADRPDLIRRDFRTDADDVPAVSLVTGVKATLRRRW